MKALLVCVSVSHGNTRKIADAMAEVLGSQVFEPEQVDAATLPDYDLVGFGSGIFSMAFHPRLREFVGALPEQQRGRAFVFATSGFPPRTGSLVRQLTGKGFDVLDGFSSRGWDTWLPFKPFGGMRKGHPDAHDLEAARSYARGLLAGVDQPA